MNPLDEQRIATLRQRIAKAAGECISWRAAGLSERYLEACTRMESHEAELASLEDRAGLERRLERAQDPSADPAAGSTAGAREQARLMTRHSIAFDGRRYHFAGYRYDRLSDAVNYSLLQGPGNGRMAANDPAVLPCVQVPSEEERREMAANRITFAGGVYRLDDHRYDRLEDALAQARFQQRTDPR